MAKRKLKRRVYQHQPIEQKKNIPPMLFGDQQIGAVYKNFYRDESFCCAANYDINLLKLCYLFTRAKRANKSIVFWRGL
jgi:hypothetical protein